MTRPASRIPLSPLSFLVRVRRGFADKTAAVDAENRAITYGELAADCDAMAGALRAHGVEQGERVAVLDLNSRWLLAAHFGVPGSGGVLVALNTRLSPSDYRAILEHSSARILFVSSAMVGALGVTRASELPVDEVVMFPGSGEGLAGATPYGSWVSRDDGRGVQPPSDEDAMIAVNYTSGTTGQPKGVIYTHRGAYLNAISVALEFQMSCESWYLWTLPMFHCNGWSLVWGATAVGATHVCLASFDAEQALELAARYPVTHLCGAPIVLAELSRVGSARGFRADPTIRAAVGGAPPTVQTIAAMQQMGFEVTHLYGLTETYGPSLVCAYQPGWTELPPPDLADRISRQGVPTVSVAEVRVAGDNLEPVPADGRTSGEILVRSNTVMAGYLDDDEATQRAFDGGWFHTGDVGVMHPDGYVELTDRSKDVIISGGENIASVEVEKVLASHPAVAEVAVVAQPHARWGERPVAFVTTIGTATVTAEELITFARERLAHFKAPDAIYFEPLPKTATGKIQKHVLRERASADSPPNEERDA